MLRPDTYFANVQVSGDVDGQNEILSTIHDAIVFKLHDIPNIKFGGILYMGQTIHFEKIAR